MTTPNRPAQGPVRGPVRGPGTDIGDAVVRDADALNRVRALARLLDSAVRVPGTRIGLGLDSILGLVPGIGDMAGAAMSGYVILSAARLGVPRTVLVRMLLNVGLDALVGAVPVLGDLFDIAWKANNRNVALLEASMGAPAATKRASAGFVALVLLGVVLVVGAGVAVGILLVRTLWNAIAG